MNSELFIAKNDDRELALLLNKANRHGLITGATGTGKTITLQVLAEKFSAAGVPVFLSDVKGDLSGLGAKAEISEKLSQRLIKLKMDTPEPSTSPITFWDVFGKDGHPLRATVSDMGPLMLSQVLGLNEVQGGVLQIVFKVADDNGLLLLDIKDLRALTHYVGENARSYSSEYGNVSSASIGAIQRGLLILDEQGGEKFFGEPMLNINDLLQSIDGKGVINILSASKLMSSPRLYGVFLLWLLAELFENLPEIGDTDKPKLVFFFDEAHLLFENAPKNLLEKIEQVVRLIRSKGVGVFFVTQNPTDVPDKILGQLGNRVQHALRAFTPRDQKSVKVAAETMRANPKIDTEQAITELAVGEALISFLNAKGAPEVVERVWVYPPASRIGMLSQDEKNQIINNSLVAGVYEKVVDAESAYEILKARQPKVETTNIKELVKQNSEASEDKSESSSLGSILGGLGNLLGGNSKRQGLAETMAKTVVRSIAGSISRQLIRGVLGSLKK